MRTLYFGISTLSKPNFFHLLAISSANCLDLAVPGTCGRSEKYLFEKKKMTNMGERSVLRYAFLICLILHRKSHLIAIRTFFRKKIFPRLTLQTFKFPETLNSNTSNTQKKCSIHLSRITFKLSCQKTTFDLQICRVLYINTYKELFIIWKAYHTALKLM